MSIYSTLISAPALHAALGGSTDLLLFDCRAKLGDLSWGYSAFQTGHIPDARHLDLDRHLAATPGAGGRHPLPDRTALAKHVRAEGLSTATQVVAYDDAGGAMAARAWWCLRWLGHGAVAVLDGGLQAWQQLSGTTLAKGPPAAAVPGDFSPGAALTQTVDAEAVLALVRAEGADTALLDARSRPRFDGVEEPIDPKAGHIPGALCRPFTDNLDATGCFKSADTLREELAPLPQPLICYCGSGVTAAHNILALVHAGLPEPALYPGSWSEWITDPARPTTP